MDLIFDPAAKKDLAEAKAHYNREKKGLGLELLDVVEVGLEHLKRYPTSAPKIHGPFRRLLVNRFPYAIVYTVEETHLFIIALAHQSRAPGYWHGRIGEAE